MCGNSARSWVLGVILAGGLVGIDWAQQPPHSSSPARSERADVKDFVTQHCWPSCKLLLGRPPKNVGRRHRDNHRVTGKIGSIERKYVCQAMSYHKGNESGI